MSPFALSKAAVPAAEADALAAQWVADGLVLHLNPRLARNEIAFAEAMKR